VDRFEYDVGAWTRVASRRSVGDGRRVDLGWGMPSTVGSSRLQLEMILRLACSSGLPDRWLARDLGVVVPSTVGLGLVFLALECV
jgi:hypothetical protein